MTAREFVELYKGRRIRVNDKGNGYGKWVSMPHLLWKTGIVASDVFGGGDTVKVLMDKDIGIDDVHWFFPTELDLIGVPDNSPLPLPG